MKIGIIGAGQIGGTLTRRLTALGHDVAVANSRGPESLADLAAETAAKPVSVKDAAKFGEIVVVTIPEKNVPDLPRDLFAETQKSVVVIDTGNYYPRQRDGWIDGIDQRERFGRNPHVGQPFELRDHRLSSCQGIVLFSQATAYGPIRVFEDSLRRHGSRRTGSWLSEDM